MLCANLKQSFRFYFLNNLQVISAISGLLSIRESSVDRQLKTAVPKLTKVFLHSNEGIIKHKGSSALILLHMLQHGANTLQYGRLNVGPKVPGHDKGAYDTYICRI